MDGSFVATRLRIASSKSFGRICPGRIFNVNSIRITFGRTGQTLEVIERMRRRPVNPAPVHSADIRPPTGASVATTKGEADSMSQLHDANSIHVDVTSPLPSRPKDKRNSTGNHQNNKWQTPTYADRTTVTMVRRKGRYHPSSSPDNSPSTQPISTGPYRSHFCSTPTKYTTLIVDLCRPPQNITTIGTGCRRYVLISDSAELAAPTHQLFIRTFRRTKACDRSLDRSSPSRNLFAQSCP